MVSILLIIDTGRGTCADAALQLQAKSTRLQQDKLFGALNAVESAAAFLRMSR